MPLVKHKIIVGIDYGTTFSGVSFITTDKTSIDDITIISSWPGDAFGSWKTPTRIAYLVENPKISTNKWGFEVYPKLKSYSWTKLLLDKNAAVGEHDDPSLSGIVGPGMFQLPSFRDAPGKTPMECWITLPAIWSEEAKAATLTAARNAGFGCNPKDEVFTIAEPEAAAIATLQKYAKPNAINPIKENENILICDCGGGTVDITTYTITQVQPYLSFDELCVGVGGKCGSTYIDRNLHALLSKRFGSAFDNLPFGLKGPGGKLMMSFEGIKRDFGRTDNDDDRDLGPINLPNVPKSEYYDPDDRIVYLSYEDMQSLFDPVIAEITGLVDQQVEEARKERKARIDRIVLVGGFGESAYLNQVLADWCRENGSITLLCHEHPQAAVVQGAALRGFEGIVPRVKHARRHYGFFMRQDFREGIDPKDKAYFDTFDNRKLCDDRMWWLISKGDEITKDTCIKAGVCRIYSPGFEFVNQTVLYSCALAEAPDYLTDSGIDRVGSIQSTFDADFDFGKSARSKYIDKKSETIHQFSSEVQVRFGEKGDNLTFKSIANGQEAGSAVIKFDR